ncbi:hypothetical protein LTS15_003896 [Exophiala xenobiotica]|nr:hypothetical protein LTS15_003896 [Exophiala xenobiotica]
MAYQWTANEARDLLGQYGGDMRGDIINDFAEPQWNETEDMMTNNNPANAADLSIQGSGYAYVDTLNTDNNDSFTESTFFSDPFFQASFDNNWPRPSYQQADPLARRIMTAKGSAAGGSDRPEGGQAHPVGHGSIQIKAYPDPSFGRAPNAGTRQSSYGIGTGVSTGNPDTMGHQYFPNALRRAIERKGPLSKAAGCGAPVPHAAGLGMRPPAPATVETGTYMSVGFPPIPGYSEPTGDLPFGDTAITPNLEKASGHAGANTNGGQYAGASLENMFAGNAARAVAVGPDAGAHDNMAGNNPATVTVGAGASVDTGGASHASGQDNMPARRGRGRPRGSKRKAPSGGQQDKRPTARARTGTRTTPTGPPVASAEQQDNRPAAVAARNLAARAARMTSPNPPVTLPDGNVSLTASSGDPAVPPNHQRKTWSVFLMHDPLCCHICFHLFQDEQPLREHYFAKHKEQEGLTKRSLYESYYYAKCSNMKTLGWYKYQGIDTTYTGDDPKMMNLHRTMRVILRPTDPEYLKEVYKDTPKAGYEAKKSKDKEATDKEATDKEATDKEATDKEATDKEATDKE